MVEIMFALVTAIVVSMPIVLSCMMLAHSDTFEHVSLFGGQVFVSIMSITTIIISILFGVLLVNFLHSDLEKGAKYEVVQETIYRRVK